MKNEKMKDIIEMTNWIEEQINNIENEDNEKNEIVVRKNETPALYYVFMGDEESLNDNEKKRYKKYLENMKKQIPVGLAAAGGSGIGAALFVGSGPAVGGGVGWAAGQSLITGGALASGIPFAPWLMPLAPLAIAGGVLLFSKKKQKGEEGDCSKRLEDSYDKCMKKLIEYSEKLEEGIKKAKEMYEEYLPKTLMAIKKESERIKINFDDMLNMDQNKRIMQYQEIALKQHKTQVELRKAMETIVKSYNELIKENQKLENQIRTFSQMGMLCCATNNLL